MLKLRFAWISLIILCLAASIWNKTALKGFAAPPQLAPCTYKATLVADVTIPDDTEVGPGTTFVKTWRLRNDGTCSWGQNNTLKTITFVDGDNLRAEEAGAFPGETPPGAMTDVYVTLHAPAQPGVYTSRWKLLVVDGAGRQQAIGVGRTGQAFYARIKVSATLPPATTPSRIEFGPGVTSGRIEDNLLGGELRTYVIKALQDQIMLVNLTPADPDFVVRVKGQNGVVPPALNPLNATWVGRLPSTQDYLIQLQANTKNTHYVLTVTIPERIQFKPGATAATLAGVTNGSHFYSLRAQQGQTMSVKFTAPRPLGFMIYGLEDGAVLHRQADGGAGWSGKLTTTQAYLVQVDQGNRGPASYTMQVTIPPITGGPPTCVDKITFIADVTVPDNTHFAPGATFTKVWRVRNDGNCAWGPAEAIHGIGFVDGARLGVRDVAPMRNYTPPGFTADVGIEMVAPQAPGVYVSNWKFLHGNGDLLGVGAQGNRPIYVKIIVDAPK
ncbi:MAG: NBR1-Ig-like domain-containing protein [Caldilineaceae bacterium]